MSRSIPALFVLCVSAFALQASETALMPPSVEPSFTFKATIGAVPSLDGNGFFVVWSEGATVLAARLTDDGTLLDRRGMVLHQRTPGYNTVVTGVRAEDGHYVLRVVESKSNYPGPYEYLTHVLHFDAEGTRLASSRTTTTNDYPSMWMPRNDSGESLYLSKGATETTVWTVDREGVKRNPTGFGSFVDPSYVTSSGNDWYFLQSSYTAGFTWYRFRPDSLPTSQKQQLTFGPAYDPSTAGFHDTVGVAAGEFAVLHERFTRPNPNQVVRSLTLAVIRADGGMTKYSLLDNDVVFSGNPSSSIASGSAALVKDGDTWVVAFSWFAGSQEELRTWRVGSTTTPSTVYAGPVLTYEGILRPVLAVDSSRTLLLFHRQRPKDGYSTATDLYAHVADRGTSILPSQPSVLLGQSHPPETTPRAASGPDGTMAVLLRGDNPELMMRFYGKFGSVTDPVRLSSGERTASEPVIVRNGTTFLVAWKEAGSSDRLFVRRFDARGVALDTEPLVVGSTLGYLSTVSAAKDNDGFRISWSQIDSLSASSQIPVVHTRHLPTRGAITTPEQSLTQAFVRTVQSITVADGTESMVLWSEDPTTSLAGVHAQRYTNGVKAPSVYFGLGTLLSAVMHGNEVAVVTAHPGPVQYQSCATVQRFALDGTPLSPPADLDGCGGTVSSSVVWDNDRLWVWWSLRPTLLQEVHADGTLGSAVQYFRSDVTPLAPHFFATGNDPSVVYTRFDVETELVEKAYLRAFPKPKGRATRH